MLDVLRMEWGTELTFTVTGADIVPVECDVCKKSLFGSGQIFFALRCSGAPDDPGAKGDNPGDDDVRPLPNDKMISIKQGDNGIRGLLNTYDMVRVEVHLLLVHTGKKNHVDTLSR